jgi:hypothetical protein
VRALRLGTAGGGALEIDAGGKTSLSLPLAELERAWATPF